MYNKQACIHEINIAHKNNNNNQPSLTFRFYKTTRVVGNNTTHTPNETLGVASTNNPKNKIKT